jgi:hypothetical protein
MIGNTKRSSVAREIKNVSNSFKNSYIFESLNLPDEHSASDLQKALIRQMKRDLSFENEFVIFVVSIRFMTVQQRQTNLIKKISSITDEDALIMLEQELSFFIHKNGKDIVDGLKPHQLEELTNMVNEPSDFDTVNESEYKRATAKWRLK